MFPIFFTIEGGVSGMAMLVIVLLGSLVLGSPFLVHQNYCAESDLQFRFLPRHRQK